LGNIKCPYCGEENKKVNIIDEGHLRLTGMSKKGNTRNIYLCSECGEVFEGFQKNEFFSKSVDIYFNRKFQYCRGNLEKADLWDKKKDE
jgi:transcription elongation factor Elf1